MRLYCKSEFRHLAAHHGHLFCYLPESKRKHLRAKFPSRIVVSPVEEFEFRDPLSVDGRNATRSSLDLSLIGSRLPPPSAEVFLFFDASWHVDAGFGFVLRLHSGGILDAGARRSAVGSSVLAEILAGCWALEEALPGSFSIFSFFFLYAIRM